MSDPTRQIAEFAAGFNVRALPATAVERVNLAFIDSLGVMLGGSQTEPAHIVTELAVEENATPLVTIAGRSIKTSPLSAAMANGVALHALDFDISTTGGQPTAGLFPALLAGAQALGAKPADVFAAYAVGFEVTLRILRACPRFGVESGWHPTGMVGTIGAAVACVRLLGGDADAIVRAIGISASLASTLTVNFGTMTKPLHAGTAARNGVFAGTLAMRGFTSSPNALMAGNGYFNNAFRGFPWSTEPFADFGSRWDLVEVGFKVKPYPCGGLGHTAIDAALEIRAALGEGVARVREVRVGVTKQAARHVKTTYPTTIEAAKFSVPYVIAQALLHGAPRLATFTDAAIANPTVQAFAAKISAAPDAEYGDSIDPNAARVSVVLDDGTTVERLVKYSLGSVQSPMSDAQVEAKFVDCAGPVLGADVASITFNTWREFGKQASFAPLWAIL